MSELTPPYVLQVPFVVIKPTYMKFRKYRVFERPEILERKRKGLPQLLGQEEDQEGWFAVPLYQRENDRNIPVRDFRLVIAHNGHNHFVPAGKFLSYCYCTLQKKDY